MTRQNKVLLWGGLTILIVVAVAAVAVFLFLRTLSRPGEATARFVPSSAAAYVSINLRPGVGQLRTARSVMDRLLTDDLLDRRDELLDDLEDETGIHFLDDVTSWLGTDLSLVFLTFDPDRPEWVMLAQIRDRPAAEDFIEDLVDYLEEEFYTEFDSGGRGDVDLWVADDEDLALGLTDDYLLIGDSEDTIEDMADNLESPPSRPLLESPDFTEARDSLPADRFLFLYVQADEALDLLEDEIDPYGGEAEAFRQARRNIPEYVAASVSFIGDGIRFDLVGEAPSGAFDFDSDNRLRSPGVLPADTLALLSMVGVDRAWEEALDPLGSLDVYTWEEFEAFSYDFEDDTGVDLERDVIDELSGEVALALLPSDLEFLSDDFDEFGVVEALLLVGVEDSQGILDTLDTFADLLEDEGFDVDRDSLSGYELVTMRPDVYEFEAYEPGYIVTEEWAVVGSNIDGLEAFHDAASGAVETLGSNPAFERIIGLAPAPLHFLFYADIAGMLEMVEEALDDEMRSDYRREVEPFVEQLGAILMAGSMTDDEMRFSVILTLRDQ